MTMTTRQDTGGLFSWEWIESTFTALSDFSSGNEPVEWRLAQRVTQYDDGVLRTELFDKGVPTQTTMLDGAAGAHDWAEVTLRHDAAGDLVWRRIENDDGTRRLDTYENGVRVEMHVVDTPGHPSGQHDWKTLTNHYDAAGAILAQTTHLDSGTLRQHVFEDGALAWTALHDPIYYSAPDPFVFGEPPPEPPTAFSAQPWESIVTWRGADGAVARRTTLYDDGDRQVLLFEGGRLVERQILDGDDDTGWHVQRVLYDADRVETDRFVFLDGEPLPDTLEILAKTGPPPLAGGNPYQPPDLDPPPVDTGAPTQEDFPPTGFFG